MTADEARLDDAAALSAADPAQMLRAVATSGAQIRRAQAAAAEAELDELTREGRPRALVVTGMGGSGIAGDVVAALAAGSSPTPVVVHRGPLLPAWVGAADLVVAVSCSGSTRETLSAAAGAARRGARLVTVGAVDSPLAELCSLHRGRHVPVVPELTPRSSMWALATPVLVLAARLALLDLGPGDADLDAAADCLDQVAERCRPDRETFVNPAKELALDFDATQVIAWGAGTVGPVAAYRLACQLAENAKVLAVSGALPEAHHNQVVAFDGGTAHDLFRDRVDDVPPRRLVLLHDDDGDADSARRVAVSEDLAREHGLPVTLIRSEGDRPAQRLASLVALIDFATVYAAIGSGIDPTPVAPIDALKGRMAVPAT